MNVGRGRTAFTTRNYIPLFPSCPTSEHWLSSSFVRPQRGFPSLFFLFFAEHSLIPPFPSFCDLPSYREMKCSNICSKRDAEMHSWLLMDIVVWKWACIQLLKDANNICGSDTHCCWCMYGGLHFCFWIGTWGMHSWSCCIIKILSVSFSCIWTLQPCRKSKIYTTM